MLTGSEVLEIKEWIEEGAKDYRLEVPFSVPNPYRVYVCNRGSDAISVIDGRQKVVSRIVDVGSPDDSSQIPVHVKERGDFYYVTLAESGKFVKIRKSDNEIVAEIDNLEFPGDFILMETSNKAYIARSLLSTSLANSVYVVNYNTMTFIREAVFPQTGLPVGLDLNLLETFLFVSDNINNVIYGINTTTDNTGEFAPILFTFNFRPTYLKLDPFGNYLYMSAPGTNELVVIDLTSRLTTAIIPVAANPRQIAVKSDASKVYVTCMDASVVDVIDRVLNSWAWSRRISNPAFSMLDGIDITKDDGLLYVTGRNSEGDFEVPYPVKSEKPPGIVGIINVATESVVKVIEVEERPGGIATE
jgi:YVTN family beta-propeller protein